MNAFETQTKSVLKMYLNAWVFSYEKENCKTSIEIES